MARLIKQHADVNAKNENGETALHISASRRTIELNAPLLVDGSSSIVAELVDAGADIHAVDRNGDTPLHRAVANGLDWTCEILVSAGADAKRVNHDKMTPLDTARKRQSSTLVQLLTTSAERLSDRNLVRPPRRR